ncbi:hypothetical protein [Agromyces sp. GXQ0307]|uniref:hypothetical protein n=1 Tax=Agromyces sp. GXQ0307 TaxID=3377835 RepID=UPI003839FB0E
MSEVPLGYVRTAGRGVTGARTLQRDAVAGRLTSVRPGVVVGTTTWSAASERARFMARIAAVVHTRRDRVVLSHESAAAVWGLPHLGRLPEVVELADHRGNLPRSRNGVAWRRTPFEPDEVEEVDGYLVTGLAQTLVDVACRRGFLAAVVALDAALAGRIDRPRRIDATVLTQLLEREPRRGARRASAAIAFADARAESVGESLSRAQMHLMGFPPPVLQAAFPRLGGGVDRTDFDWPEYGCFGEFDGDVKYLDPAYRSGRTIEQVILDEKKRADRIRRRYGRTEIRWDWSTARSAPRFRALLLDAGLPVVRRSITPR